MVTPDRTVDAAGTRYGDGLAGLQRLLRAHHFKVGPGELIAATRLVAHLDAAGRATRLEALSTYLSAVYCKSADEQQRFRRIFEQWAADLAAEEAAPATLADQTTAAVAPSTLARRERITRWGIALFLALASLWVAVDQWRKPDEVAPAAPAPSAPANGPSAVNKSRLAEGPKDIANVAFQGHFAPMTREHRELRPWVVYTLVSLPLGVLTLLYLPALVLAQGHGRARNAGHLPLDKSFWRKEAERIVPKLDPAIAARLDRHCWLPRDANVFGVRRILDPERTLRATLRRGGRFALRFRPQRVRPQYLVLLDVHDEYDVRGRMFFHWADRLRRQGVIVDIWFFDHDPRILFPPDPRVRVRGDPRHPVPFAEVSKRGSGVERLVIVSDGTSFADSEGHVAAWWDEMRWQRWPQRVMFTPLDPRDWGERELAVERASERGDTGFLVLPLEQEALDAYSIGLNSGTLPPIILPAARRYPPTLARLPLHGRSHEAPPAKDLEQLIAELRLYLGENGLRWLAACAVPPLVRWELTLLLGEAVFRALGAGAKDGRRDGDGLRWLMVTNYSRIARLPWLRSPRKVPAPLPGTGAQSSDDSPYIPDWLRLRLLQELPAPVRKQIRDIVADLLDPPRDIKGKAGGDYLDLPFAVRTNDTKQIGDEPSRTDLVNHWLYLGFMDGLSPRELQLRAPKRWRELMGAKLVLASAETWLLRISESLRTLWARIVWRDTALAGEISWAPAGALVALLIAGVAIADRVARIHSELPPWLDAALLVDRHFGVGAVHQARINEASFGPDGRYFLTAGDDYDAHLWDTESGRPIAPIMRHAGRVTHTTVHTNNQLIATASADGYARVWDRATGKLRMRYYSATGGPSSIAFSPVNSELVVSSGPPEFTTLHRVGSSVFDVSVEQIRPFAAHLSAFSPDGAHLALAGGQRAIVLAVPGYAPQLEVQHSARIGFVTFSPDGRWLLTASDDNTARVTGIVSDAKYTISHGGPVVHAAFSSDSRLVATTSLDGIVSLSSLNENGLTERFTARGPAVLKVAFHPTEAVIASGAVDGRVVIRSASDGEPIGKVLLHPGAITALSFDAEGTKLLTSSANAAHLWQLQLSSDQAATIAPPRDVNGTNALRLDLLTILIVAFACVAIAIETRLSARLRRFGNSAGPAPRASN